MAKKRVKFTNRVSGRLKKWFHGGLDVQSTHRQSSNDHSEALNHAYSTLIQYVPMFGDEGLSLPIVYFHSSFRHTLHTQEIHILLSNRHDNYQNCAR